MSRPAPVTSRLRIGTTGINFYSANGSVSSILTDNNGILNIVGTVTGSTGYFNAIVTTKIGERAGSVNQGYNSIAFGNNAGNDNQGGSSVAIGNNAGSSLQRSSSVAIGDGAGASKQSQQSVAIGNNAGNLEQSQRSVAIGYGAGYDKQGSSSVAIGSIAGYNYQGTGSIAIGNNAGSHIQNPQAIAIGLNAGSSLQGTGSIAIGLNAGLYNQGNNSIAIGNNAGPTGMSANTIILNASGTALYYTGPTGGFFVAPIQTTSVVGQNMILGYGPDNQIVGLTGDALAQFGIGSSSTTSTDPFVKSNFIDPPPLPENISVTGSSSDIYVTYDYPKQTRYGFGLLPSISSLNISIENTGFTGTSSDFIKSISTSNVVECINITKQGTEGLGNRNGKRMYTIRYPNLPNTSPNPNFYLWYANSSLSKSMYSTYLSYINSGLPSQPTLITSTPPPTINSIPFTFKGSDKIDTVDPTSSADLRFNIYYAPVSNTKRYGGPVGVTGEYKNSLNGPSSSTISYNTFGNFFNVTGNTGLSYSGTITSAVYPDTTYSVDVNASNSISSGFTGISLGNFTTPSSLPPTFVSSGSNLVGLSGLISGKSVLGGGIVTNILPPNTSSSFTQTFPIHNGTGSRGATGATPLVTFTSSVTGPAGTTITGPSASYTGFGPSYVYGTSSAGNINMTLSTPTDVTGLAGYDGYYLRGNVTTAMSTTLTNGLVASATPYALSVTGAYSSNNSSVSANYYAPFYYDGQLPSQPTIGGTPTLSITSAVTGMECGITVVTSSVVASLTVPGVTGIGNIFYNSNNILTYAGSFGTLSSNGETGLSNANLVSGAYTFTNNLTITALPAFRQSAITLGVTPFNLYGIAGSSKSATTTDMIFIDSNSVANSLISFPGSYTNQISFSSSTNFVRVYSTTDPTACTKRPSSSTINDITINNNGTATSYSAFLYDNTQSLSSIGYGNELLYTGMSSSSSIFVGGPSLTYYINYNESAGGYKYNTNANYSGIRTGIRYVTFAWRVNPSVFSSTTPIGTLTFTLQGVVGMTVTSGTVYPTGSSTPLFIYYRVEDSSSLNLPTNSPAPCITTFWINANDTGGSSGSLINSSNCYNDSNASSVPYYIGVTPPNATGTTTITLPAKTGGFGFSSSNRPASGNNTPVYVYLRIGLPIQTSNLYFTNVTCALT